MPDPNDSPTEPLFMAVPNQDPRLAEAHRRASETLEDFKRHLTINDGRLCSVKLRFRDPDLSERLGEDRFLFLWLGNAYFHEDEGCFSAEFFELPEEFTKWHHVGERLGIDPEDIFDWMVLDEGRLYGGFTLRLNRSLLPEDKRADFDAHIGVSHYQEMTAPI